MVIFRINQDFLKQVLVENNWKLVLNSSREGKKVQLSQGFYFNRKQESRKRILLATLIILKGFI